MKNFIWDFDGTLFDTYPHTVAILQRYMAERGRQYDYAALYAVCRTHMGQARAFCKADEAEWNEFFRREADMDQAPQAAPYPETGSVLAAVTRCGGRNFLYTHRDAVSVKYLERFDLLKYFTGLVTREDAFPQKPAPDAIRYLLRRYSLDPSETVMVGDREIDIRSGRNAGVHTCLYTEGNPGAPVSSAEYVASTMAALRTLFLK